MTRPAGAFPGFHQTGLRPEPPASTCRDPCAPRRSRRGAPCAPCGVCTVLRRRLLVLLVCVAGVTGGGGVLAQEQRIASPPGRSATQVGGTYDERAGYVGGQWIEIRYGRPIKRGRDLFGPADYREFLNDGAPVWRAGANQSTQLLTEMPLVFGGQALPPGEYTVFIDLATDPWTFVVSTWPAQQEYDYENKEALFGAYYYTPDKDVVRVPMQRETGPYAHDQLSWQFVDVTGSGGRLALFWDTVVASVPFTVGE